MTAVLAFLAGAFTLAAAIDLGTALGLSVSEAHPVSAWLLSAGIAPTVAIAALRVVVIGSLTVIIARRYPVLAVALLGLAVAAGCVGIASNVMAVGT